MSLAVAATGREAFTYPPLRRTGTVHVEQVLKYNHDPTYLRDLLLYRLTLEAQKRVAESPLSKREFKSTDGGETWFAVNLGLFDTSVFGLAADPRRPGTFYVSGPHGIFATTT